MEMFSLLLSVQITVKYCLQLFWCLYLDNNCYDLTEDESALVEHDKDDTVDDPTKKPRILPCNCHGLLLGIQNVLEIAKNVSISGKPNRDKDDTLDEPTIKT